MAAWRSSEDFLAQIIPVRQLRLLNLFLILEIHIWKQFWGLLAIVQLREIERFLLLFAENTWRNDSF